MSTANHQLTNNFRAFFKRLNPSVTYERAAASAHSQISSLIESREGTTGDLRINCFLQGSYRRDTAIHTINDVDIVALCSLSHTPDANQNTRNQIFRMIADAVASNKIYKDKICYQECSICIKVLLEGIKIEILPALREKGKPYDYEPFFMFRPASDEITGGEWRHAFARYHQKLCTEKNAATNGLFIPVIKVLKHLRFIDTKLNKEDAVSFHIECLLYALKNQIYSGSISECIEGVLRAIAGFTTDKAISSNLKTPSNDKHLFTLEEWDIASYDRFHKVAVKWHEIAKQANEETDKDKAIDAWKRLLGKDYFPRTLQ